MLRLDQGTLVPPDPSFARDLGTQPLEFVFPSTIVSVLVGSDLTIETAEIPVDLETPVTGLGLGGPSGVTLELDGTLVLVPEPATALLLLGSLGLLAWVRPRRG